MGLYNIACPGCGKDHAWFSGDLDQRCSECMAQPSSSLVFVNPNEFKPTSSRPTFESIFMGLAQAIAERATCKRLKVGTVITSTDFRKVLAVGYNGNAAGLPNCCDRDEPGNCGCLHSEDNAVVNCDSPRSVEKIVFVTHLPCPMCAKRLINLGGVKKVYFHNDYRYQEAKDFFAAAKIELKQL